uniref:Uncharacterized protein n=1 Tax=Rhizophora mucronata TaxID=61149 RepID=A0A2P2P9S0_RHIMU
MSFTKYVVKENPENLKSMVNSTFPSLNCFCPSSHPVVFSSPSSSTKRSYATISFSIYGSRAVAL